MRNGLLAPRIAHNLTHDQLHMRGQKYRNCALSSQGNIHQRRYPGALMFYEPAHG